MVPPWSSRRVNHRTIRLLLECLLPPCLMDVASCVWRIGDDNAWPAKIEKTRHKQRLNAITWPIDPCISGMQSIHALLLFQSIIRSREKGHKLSLAPTHGAFVGCLCDACKAHAKVATLLAHYLARIDKAHGARFVSLGDFTVTSSGDNG